MTFLVWHVPFMMTVVNLKKRLLFAWTLFWLSMLLTYACPCLAQLKCAEVLTSASPQEIRSLAASLVERGFNSEVAEKFAQANPDLVATLLKNPKMRAVTVYRGLKNVSVEQFDPQFRDHHFGALSYEVNTTTNKVDAISYAVWEGQGLLLQLQIPNLGISKPSYDSSEFKEFRNSSIDYVIDSRKLLDRDISPFLLKVWEVTDKKPNRPGFRKITNKDSGEEFWIKEIE